MMVVSGNVVTTPPANPCSPNPCRNGGTCQPNGAGSFMCLCPIGFSGICCEIRTYSLLNALSTTFVPSM